MNKMGVEDLYFPIPSHSALLPGCLALNVCTTKQSIAQKCSSSVLRAAFA